MSFARAVTAAMLVLSCALISQSADATLVSGNVTDTTTSAPLQGVTVQAFESFPDPLFSANTTTDLNGDYQIDVPTGYPQITASLDPYIAQTQYLTLDSTPQTANFALASAGSIAGSVRIAASDTSLANATVSLLDPQSKSVINQTSTANDGSYSFAGLTPGQYAVCVIDPTDIYLDTCYDGMPVGADGAINFTAVNVGSGQTVTGIDFALQVGANVSGTLRDSYFNVPIPNADMAMTLYSNTQKFLSSIQVTTDANGSYILHGLAPASYYLAARGYAQQQQPNTVYAYALYGGGALLAVPDGGIAGIDFALFPGHIVQGRVTDAATGQGIAGVALQAGELACNLFCITATTTSDANGNYTLAHIQGSDIPHVATVGAVGYIDQVWQNTPCAPASQCATGTSGNEIKFSAPNQILTGIDFTLQRGSSISGRITMKEYPDIGVANAHVAAYYDDGQSGPQLIQTTRTNANGDYATDGWSSGTYYIAAWNDDISNDCEFYGGNACPNQVPPYLTVSNATPIAISSATVQSGINVQLHVETIFQSGFE